MNNNNSFEVEDESNKDNIENQGVYNLTDRNKLNIKVLVWWNIIAAIITDVYLFFTYYADGWTYLGSFILVLVVTLIMLPLLIGNYIVYRKAISNPTKRVIIMGLVFAIISIFVLAKLPSIALVVVYIMILVNKNKS